MSQTAQKRQLYWPLIFCGSRFPSNWEAHLSSHRPLRGSLGARKTSRSGSITKNDILSPQALPAHWLQTSNLLPDLVETHATPSWSDRTSLSRLRTSSLREPESLLAAQNLCHTCAKAVGILIQSALDQFNVHYF